MLAKVRYLLLQIRNEGDEMARHEIECFARVLECDEANIMPYDLLVGPPNQEDVDAADVLLVGGSGDYSATHEFDWLDDAMHFFRALCQQQKPVFGSCWGFQALAKAFGGTVEHNMELAELGTLPIHLTDEGQQDPVFGPLGPSFHAPVGHEDSVIVMPENCTLLGTSSKANQILRCDTAPIYATQFHPELDREALVARIRRYPKYVEKICNSTFEAFAAECEETPRMKEILPRFVRQVLGD